MQTTARAIITRALRLLKVIAANESGDAADLDVGFNSLNDMLDSWSINRNNLLATVIETFPLVNNQASYTIGTGGDFNTTLPMKVEESSYISYQGVDYPLRSVTQDTYSQIPFKTNGGIPEVFWFDPSATLATIYFYPVPQTLQSIQMHSLKPMTAFTSLDASYTLPPGYKEALQFSLAEALASEFETEAPKFVILKAMTLRRSLQRKNVVVPDMTIDQVPAPQNTTFFDWRYGA
jgi:hypothetical protein